MGDEKGSDPESVHTDHPDVVIDLLFVDPEGCKRVGASVINLEQARQVVSRVMDTLGVTLTLRSHHVDTLEKAQSLGLRISPTIRINGHDLQPDMGESRCPECSERRGEDVNCRTWSFIGNTYNAPPPAMIVEAILSELYDPQPPAPPPTGQVPARVRRLFVSSPGE
jgi:uncharacterized protein DUF2703